MWSIDREVVADHQVGEAALGAQAREQVQHLGLHRGVERRGRLVEQQDLGLEHQRPGDGDALALAAGELVGVAEAEARVEADVGQRLQHAGVAAADAVDRERLGERRVDGALGVQRAVGVLEHHLHPAGEGAVAPARHRLAADADLAAGDRREAADRAQDRRLAGAGLADEAEGLARRATAKETSRTARTLRAALRRR